MNSNHEKPDLVGSLNCHLPVQPCLGKALQQGPFPRQQNPTNMGQTSHTRQQYQPYMYLSQPDVMSVRQNYLNPVGMNPVSCHLHSFTPHPSLALHSGYTQPQMGPFNLGSSASGLTASLPQQFSQVHTFGTPSTAADQLYQPSHAQAGGHTIGSQYNAVRLFEDPCRSVKKKKNEPAQSYYCGEVQESAQNNFVIKEENNIPCVAYFQTHQTGQRLIAPRLQNSYGFSEAQGLRSFIKNTSQQMSQNTSFVQMKPRYTEVAGLSVGRPLLPQASHSYSITRDRQPNNSSSLGTPHLELANTGTSASSRSQTNVADTKPTVNNKLEYVCMESLWQFGQQLEKDSIAHDLDICPSILDDLFELEASVLSSQSSERSNSDEHQLNISNTDSLMASMSAGPSQDQSSSRDQCPDMLAVIEEAMCSKSDKLEFPSSINKSDEFPDLTCVKRERDTSPSLVTETEGVQPGGPQWTVMKYETSAEKPTLCPVHHTRGCEALTTYSQLVKVKEEPPSTPLKSDMVQSPYWEINDLQSCRIVLDEILASLENDCKKCTMISDGETLPNQESTGTNEKKCDTLAKTDLFETRAGSPVKVLKDSEKQPQEEKEPAIMVNIKKAHPDTDTNPDLDCVKGEAKSSRPEIYEKKTGTCVISLYAEGTWESSRCNMEKSDSEDQNSNNEDSSSDPCDGDDDEVDDNKDEEYADKKSCKRRLYEDITEFTQANALPDVTRAKYANSQAYKNCMLKRPGELKDTSLSCCQSVAKGKGGSTLELAEGGPLPDGMSGSDSEELFGNCNSPCCSLSGQASDSAPPSTQSSSSPIPCPHDIESVSKYDTPPRTCGKRKPLTPYKSPYSRDPSFRGVVMKMKTELQEDKAHLDIKAYFR